MKFMRFFILFILLFSFGENVNAASYYVTGDGVRVRSSAENLEDNVIGKLNYGDKVEVIDLENSWYKIKYNDDYGYVTYRYISKLEDSYKTNSIGLLKSKVGLKEKNSSSSKTIVYIPKNGVVKVLEKKSKWSLVEYNEKVGYVKTNQLKMYTKLTETVIGSYTINYSLSNSARNSNINKSMKRLNNIVIKSGEKFSFLDRVERNGYLNAIEFNKKEKVSGGGLSEVATALYLTIRDAKRNDCYINVLEQNRYSSKTPYAKIGEEAMIDIENNKDLVFINKSDKNIKIYSNVSGNNVSFVISEI